MRDLPPLYSAILRALAEALAANLPNRSPERHDAAPTLRDCTPAQHASDQRPA
ncbi:hypothetical protein NJC40_19670 [Pseudomonas sp. 21LCFQ02]|uniref:hypothetical protein n=1 Tax=unclassified Pseudomonas TaxID=196821 RepID=UPI0004F749C0|nr:MULTISPECIES: hypothetical protein [unclassified Pseudomonas]MCO8163571.1 hypothetical protein [Pseudomonas sp. 21LCFQ010]MCO8169987.1 hypothetical protein [Pseudomonas sp. 21LCFQ02]MCQ9426514.1 hypothetical protein [Pseudomonas sp. LJDD11]BAP40729.1 putative uncharacterized protein [Pseudomonas sp. StFLB209]